MLDQVNSAPRPALLKQAEIPPVQRDGVFPFAVGSVLAAVISVVLYLLGEQVPSWLWQSAAVAVVIGVFATIYCLIRRQKLLTES